LDELDTTAAIDSVEAIVDSFYQAISFRTGEQPDWTQLRELFTPGAQHIYARSESTRLIDLETFTTRFREQIETGELNGFSEIDAARQTELFGDVAHVFSIYETRFATGDSMNSARGVNSIQLLKDEGRWWIVTILWNDESQDDPTLAD